MAEISASLATMVTDRVGRKFRFEDFTKGAFQ
jgi:hypothetical protein